MILLPIAGLLIGLGLIVYSFSISNEGLTPNWKSKTIHMLGLMIGCANGLWLGMSIW